MMTRSHRNINRHYTFAEFNFQFFLFVVVVVVVVFSLAPYGTPYCVHLRRFPGCFWLIGSYAKPLTNFNPGNRPVSPLKQTGSQSAIEEFVNELA